MSTAPINEIKAARHSGFRFATGQTIMKVDAINLSQQPAAKEARCAIRIKIKREELGSTGIGLAIPQPHDELGRVP